MHLPIHTLLQGGKYRIIRFISSGGFGCTYEAEHVMLEKRVAIKEFFVKDFCNRDETSSHVSVGTHSKQGLVNKLRRKFIDEARALCKLQHPGIVGVSDVFEENGTAYFVMDYIEGRSLGDLLTDEGPMSEERAVTCIRQVAAALACVHEHNRLHLDLKPGNIMINTEGNALLIDFGASKQYDEQDGENTSTLIGKTPGYAPPEQMSNSVVKFLPATDIYALGATLYKMLTGTTPLDVNLRISGEQQAALPDTVSAPTRRAVEQALLLAKNERPQTVAAFLALLDAPAPKPQPEEQPKPEAAEKTRVTGAAGSAAAKAEAVADDDVVVLDEPGKATGAVKAGAAKAADAAAGSAAAADEETEFNDTAKGHTPGASGSGAPVTPKTPEKRIVSIEELKKSEKSDKPAKPGARNWFVGTWLWLMILGNLALFVAFCFEIYYHYTLADIITPRVLAICFLTAAFSCYLLWRRIRWGYWLLLLAYIALSLYLGYEDSWESLLIAFLVFGTLSAGLFAILQITKNRVSAWKVSDYSFAKSGMLPAWIILGLGLAVALFLPNYRQLDARANWESYQEQVEACRAKINEGSQSNPQALIEAKDMLAGIQFDEYLYEDIDARYNESVVLERLIVDKAAEAAQGWATAGDSQARIGNEDKALEFYTTALQLDSEDADIRAKFEQVAAKYGYLKPTDILFSGEGEWGETLYANQIKYLYLQMNYDSLDPERSHGNVRVIVKIYNNGVLKYNTSAYSSNYSYHDDIEVKAGTGNVVTLSGWGSEEGGTYNAGSLRAEIWVGNKKLFTKSATIY